VSTGLGRLWEGGGVARTDCVVFGGKKEVKLRGKERWRGGG